MRRHLGSPAHRALGLQTGRSYLLFNSLQVGLACVVGGAAALRPLTLCDSRLFPALSLPTGLLCSVTVAQLGTMCDENPQPAYPSHGYRPSW